MKSKSYRNSNQHLIREQFVIGFTRKLFDLFSSTKKDFILEVLRLIFFNFRLGLIIIISVQSLLNIFFPVKSKALYSIKYIYLTYISSCSSRSNVSFLNCSLISCSISTAFNAAFLSSVNLSIPPPRI